MAEIDNYDRGVDTELRKLDRLVADPMLMDRLSDAQELWREMLPGIKSEEDLVRAIHSLDTNCWGPYMGRQALLTGWVEEVNVFSSGTLCSEESEGSAGGVENWPVQSMGFTIIVREDDSYNLGLIYQSDAKDEHGNLSSRYFATTCDQHLSFPEVISLDHMCAVLEEYLPNLTSQIDEAVLNTTKGRGEALGALRGLDYSELEEIAERDPVLYGRLSIALPAYVHRTIDLDTAMPYVIDYDGPVIFNDGNSLGSMSQRGLAATVHYLKIAEPIPGPDETGLTLAAFSTLHREHQDEDIQVELRVDSIKDPLSTRDSAYSKIL